MRGHPARGDGDAGAALVRVDRLQLGRLADDAVLRPAACQCLRADDDIVRADVSALFVGGDDDCKRLFEVIVAEAAGRGNRRGQGTLHIGRAAAHQASIFQHRRERFPAGVARHGVRMAEQAEPAGPFAPLGDQADLLLTGRVDIGDFLDGEAALLQHPAQEIGDPAGCLSASPRALRSVHWRVRQRRWSWLSSFAYGL